jgi:hypothetical protein
MYPVNRIPAADSFSGSSGASMSSSLSAGARLRVTQADNRNITCVTLRCSNLTIGQITFAALRGFLLKIWPIRRISGPKAVRIFVETPKRFKHRIWRNLESKKSLNFF